jgi:hypothetical protein
LSIAVTLCLAAFDAAEKRFGRCKLLNAESVRRQEAVETFQHAWIVFNDCNGEHAIANLIEAMDLVQGDGKRSLALKDSVGSC